MAQRITSSRKMLVVMTTYLVLVAILQPASGDTRRGVADQLADYAEFVKIYGHSMQLSAEPPDTGLISAACLADLNGLMSNTSEETIQILDSFGKPASGILAGNLAWLGHFDQCMSIQEYRHCLVGLAANLTAVLGANVVLPIQWGVCVPETCDGEDVRNALELLLEILGVEGLSLSSVDGSEVYCTDKPNTDFDAGFIATCSFISLLAALAILGSIVDYYQNRPTTIVDSYTSGRWFSIENSPVDANGHRHGDGRSAGYGSVEENVYAEMGPGDREDSEINTACNSPAKKPSENSPLLAKETTPESETVTLSMVIQHDTKPSVWIRFLLCFAISRNLPKILGMKQAKGGVPCLNGIRVISISWVILGHTLVMTIFSNTSENMMLALGRWLDNFSFMAISNAYPAVDTFFFLSGLLVCYLILNKMKETGGKIPWVWFYVHRYLRLTPSLALLILVLMFVLPNLGQGPVWGLHSFYQQFCSDWWWTDLLYINNLVPDGTKDCVNWGWYLANDMQFYVLSPLFILPLFWFPALGLCALAVACLVSFITSSVLVYQHDYLPGFFLQMAGFFLPSLAGRGADLTYQKVIYVKPYCRIPPYLVGMAMGYVLYWIGGRRVRMSPILVAAGWAAAGGVGMSVIYGLFDAHRGAIVPNMAASIAYNGLYAFAWAIALSWVVFACHFGYGGVINSFLSWSLWIPLSRLTYATYLFHPIVIYLYSFSMATPFHWSALTLVYLFVSYLVLAHFVALFVALLVEFPVGNLEKMLMNPSATRDKKERV